MSQSVADLSIADLERLMEEKQVFLQGLLRKRDQLQKEIEDLDAEMQNAANLDSPLVRGRRRRRVRNETPLRTVVLQILAKNKKGLSLSDLADKVSESGYKSGSRNFKNVVYQTLYHSHDVVHDEVTGCYRLKK